MAWTTPGVLRKPDGGWTGSGKKENLLKQESFFYPVMILINYRSITAENTKGGSIPVP